VRSCACIDRAHSLCWQLERYVEELIAERTERLRLNDDVAALKTKLELQRELLQRAGGPSAPAAPASDRPVGEADGAELAERMSATVTALEERNAHLEREMQRLIVRAQPRYRRVGAAAIDASAVVVSSFASAPFCMRRVASRTRCGAACARAGTGRPSALNP
jgi:hypothetical protein